MKAEKLLCDSKGFPGYCQVVYIYFLTLLSACSLTVTNSGNPQWRNLTAKGTGFCALWDLKPVCDIVFNKNLLPENVLVCSFCWEQKVNLQLCQGGEKEGEAEVQKMVSSCLNVNAVFCCELLYLQHSWIHLYQLEQSAAGQEVCSREPGGDFWGKSYRCKGNKCTLEIDQHLKSQ